MSAHNPGNTPATTDRLPTGSVYETEVENQAQYMFTWWRDSNPDQELDSDTIATLRIQARMIVDEFRARDAAEEVAWIMGRT
ncbi:hypothetical protein IEU95_01805 [Hoyosella rhizosphaerae]|uniref:Uncharacterized protein n=1 Tax=Hoyosella rhizosphaerae TaxID=1755582 RepID=A0A916UEQ7_9ACTN|nr:hypothetical protein [Hoyosella rhizosphaerae]MBN4925550.1 hypothetical protein [Hoyosella rhizosphaerae]GGC69790.1 hypothetical protein GCM10011410_23260 [Hoyosella rhizosphaerae]